MYRILVTPTFEKDIEKIDTVIAERIIEKIEIIATNHDAPGTPLSHLPLAFKKLRKQRIGDWRVLFWLDESKKEMTLYAVEHRRSIYKRLR